MAQYIPLPITDPNDPYGFVAQRERIRQTEEVAKAALEEIYELLEEVHGHGAYGVLQRYCIEYRPAYNTDPNAYKKRTLPKGLRRAVLERDAYRCQECGGWEDLCVDHIVPESKGGPDTLENLRALCRTCNSRKGDRV